MNDITLSRPIVGTNQYKVKFGQRIKRKLRISVKVKVAVVSLLIVSLYLNWYLIKTNYVFTCTAYIGGQAQDWKLGHFESQRNCDALVDAQISYINNLNK
jgi:hypothetical protein